MNTADSLSTPSSPPVPAESPAPMVPATSAPLLAAAFLLENACKAPNDVFIRCRVDSTDPAACLPAADAVLECTRGFFRRLAASRCQALFTRFWRCLDMNNQDRIYCRGEEDAFLQCARSELGVSKRLWQSYHPARGLKEEGEIPEGGSWRYQWHVWTHKNNV